MKYWVVIFVLSLVACSAPQTVSTQTPGSIQTPVPFTPTPQIIEVTRIIKVEQTVIVTAIPELLAQQCFDQAVTQGDLNNCAIEERLASQAELENIISQIELSSEEKQEFDKLQIEWENIAERNCMFYYDKWGSMRPMQQSMCIALRIKERTKELKLVYLTPDG